MAFLKVDLEMLMDNMLSKEAVLLYSYLVSLKGMSERNNIIDENGKTVVFCKNDKAMEILNVSKPTVIKIFKELEELNYIKRVRRGLCKASYIYVNDKPEVRHHTCVSTDNQVGGHFVHTQLNSCEIEPDNVDTFMEKEGIKEEVGELCTVQIEDGKNITELKVGILPEAESVIKENESKTESMLKVCRAKSAMDEIIKQKNLDLPQTVINMIISKIQLSNYKIYNMYRYILKCIENYFESSANVVSYRQKINKFYNSDKKSKFCDFPQREYSVEEISAIEKRLLTWSCMAI